MIPGVQNPHWLAPVAAEGIGPPPGLREALERGDGSARHPAGGGHAGDPRRAVDQDRAAAALALRAAAVLGRLQAEPVAEHLEQRGTVVGHGDRPAVDLQRDAADDADLAMLARLPSTGARIGSPG